MLRQPTSLALALALAALTSTLAARSAHAGDRFAGTRSPKLVERAHRVRIVLEGDHARLHVEREVFNGGARPDQATFWIAPPDGAVATRLRTLGELAGRPTWFEGELMEAEAAAAKYRELTGLGGYYPKDPALLSWRSQDQLALQVFPCMPGVSKKVDYELLVPTTYDEGRWVLDLPPMGTADTRAVATVEVGSRGGRATLDGREIAPRVPISLDRPRSFELAPVMRSPIDGALASLPLGGDRHATHYHLEAAPRLSEIPTGARIVIALDTSRSVSEEQQAVSIAAARTYLQHFEGRSAKVALVGFARRAEPLSPGFVDVGTASRLLAARPLPRKNGSELGAAIELARSLLDEAPARAPRRLLVLSDLETREALSPTSVARALPRPAIAHFSTVQLGPAKLERDDEHDWASLPRSTGGLYWRTTLPGGRPLDAEERAELEEWARPRKIDLLALDAPGGPPIHVPGSLREGEGLSTRGIGSPLPHVSLSGELWSTPIRHTVLEQPGEAERWSALIFGTELFGQLSEEEMMRLAMRGGAVSPVTSYLAIEPGVRPSFEGLEDGERGGTGMGFGSGTGRAMGTVRHGAVGLGFDREAWLRERTREIASACGVTTEVVGVELETTRWEIVEVAATLSPAADARRDCIVERLWDLELPTAFSDAHARFAVQP